MSTEFLNCKPFRVFPAPERKIQCEAVHRFLEEAVLSRLKGRKFLLKGDFQGQNCLLRRFAHGGLLRHVFRECYIGAIPRAVRELEILSSLKKQGFPVVEPVFALVEKKPVGYHQALVTVYLSHTTDLAGVENLTPDALELLIKLLERFFDAGLYHPDLNIKNILIDRVSGAYFLLDFDRAALLPGALAPVERSRIYKRLFRSFDKLGKFHFWEGFPFGTVPDYVGEAMKNYRKIRRIRAFFWKLNRK
ncbi:MAG: hypothetical protein GXO69_01775 [Acidobacteria bacterium]|nr:hypothetical protein [Acidobacteriota bacterium]